ncbi:helix-turn-helix domain-containing protein [Morganella morganii]|uniref:helix-turn-helix domain-containing protein n=1 Tax=Morganella morganii TaxID=582 RepID=UPI003EBDFC04
MDSIQMLLHNVGKLIRELRKEKKMSGVDLAAAIGISQQQISRYERGESDISITMFFNIILVFNMTPTEFFLRMYETERESASKYFSMKW